MNRSRVRRDRLLTAGRLVILLVLGAALLFACSELRASAGMTKTTSAESQTSGAPTAAAQIISPDPGEEYNLPPTASVTIPADVTPTNTDLPSSGSTATPAADPYPLPFPTALQASRSVPVSDLLFIAGDELRLWDRRANKTRTLSQNVSEIVVSTDGRSVLVLHPRKMTVNGVQAFDLDLLSLETESLSALQTEMPRPYDLALSPAGDRVAYRIDTEPARVIWLATDGGSAETVAACSGFDPCDSLAWAPDGKSLAWSDSSGLWLVSLTQDKPRLCHGHQVQVIDPRGQSSLYAVRFENLRWSPDGRFILAQIVPDDSPVNWQAVLDVRTGVLAGIPDTFSSGMEPVQTAWLSPNQVWVAQGSDTLHGLPPFIHLWNVFYTNPDLLVSGKQYSLYSDEFPFSTLSSKSIPSHSLDWITPAGPGKLLVGVKLAAAETEPVIFSLDLALGKLARIGSLPTHTTNLVWAPDGSGALASGRGGRFYFLSLPGGDLINLDNAFPPDTHHLHWLIPAMPRKPAR